MTKQTIYLGATANDNTGDTLRAAGAKINSNFSEIYTFLGGDSTSINLNVSFYDSGVRYISPDVPNYTSLLNFQNPTANNTIVLPDGSYTLIGDNLTQTLKNKTLKDTVLSSISIKDLDSSHVYIIKTANISADRQVTIPSIASNDVFVLRDDAATLTNKTLTAPVLTSPLIKTLIADSLGAELIKLPSVNNAVNEITVKNAISGQGPTISATGDDTNINLNIQSKGTGGVVINGVKIAGSTISGDSATAPVTWSAKLVYGSETLTSSGAISINVPLTIFNSGAGLSMTLANGLNVGEAKKLINIGAANVTVTPTSFAHGTSFTMKEKGTIEAIFVGASVATGKWYLLGQDSGDLITITV